MILVSKQSMIKTLEKYKDDSEFLQHYVGRALCGLFDRQVADERQTNTTRLTNTVGFSSSDARSGSITAKFYRKHNRLEDWQVREWLRDFRGSPRITKYHAQLNQIAEQKKKGA